MLEKKESKNEKKDVTSKVELIEEVLLQNVSGGGGEHCGVTTRCAAGGGRVETCKWDMPIIVKP